MHYRATIDCSVVFCVCVCNGRTREELAQREKLISEYGFSVISEFDEDGNLVKTNDKVRFVISCISATQRAF